MAPAKKLLQVIQQDDTFKNVRLHVTTRPHMRQELEETLGTLSYTILPFQKHDQIQFLVKFWTCNLPEIQQNIQYTLENFAERCLEALKKNVTIGEEDIAGVPLQCQLLGEIYQSDARREMTDPNSNIQKLVPTIFHMFSKLMGLRFEKAENQQRIKEKSKFVPGKLLATLPGKKSWKEKMKQVHYLAAIELLFPEFMHSVKQILSLDHKKYLSQGRKEVYDIGLIENKTAFSSNYRFGHRTYAEFLVAEFLVDIITSNNEAVTNNYYFVHFLFKHILKSQKNVKQVLSHTFSDIQSCINLRRFDNFVITYFINSQLSVKKVKIGTIYKQLATMSFDDQIFHNIFISCAVTNLKHLYMFLMNMYTKIRHHKFRIPAALVIAAVKFSDFEFIDHINNQFSEKVRIIFDSSSDKYKLVTPVQIAVEQGNYQVVHGLFKKYKKPGRYLLHICLKESLYDSEDIIREKLDIMELIVASNQHYMDEELESDGSTPILQTNANLRLIEYLLSKGALVNANTKSNENILHRFLKRSKKDKNKDASLFEFLEQISRFQFDGFRTVNLMGETPLSIALETTNMSIPLLEVFKTGGTDFQFCNKNGENLMFIAIKSKQSLDCIQQLQAYGVNTKSLNNNNESLLHVATNVVHSDAVEFLLNDPNVLVNAQDSESNTPMHIAFSKYSNESLAAFQIQTSLLINGVNLFIKNHNGNTPIEYGLEHSTGLAITVEQLKALENLDYQLSKESAGNFLRAILMNKNSIDWDINSASELRNILRHLISVGGRINCEGEAVPTKYFGLRTKIFEIAQNLKSKYLHEVSTNEPIDVFKMIVENVLVKNNIDISLIDTLVCNKISIEFVISVLLCLEDKTSLRQLQKAYQLIPSKSSRFVDDELAEVYSRSQGKIVVISSDCIPFTVAKFQEQVDPFIQVFDMAIFNNIWTGIDTDVIIIVSDIEIENFFSICKTFPHRIICINNCKSETKISLTEHNIFYYYDEYKWESLSPDLRSELLTRFKGDRYEEYYDAKDNFHRLGMLELWNPTVIPRRFLISKKVQTIMKEILGSDKYSACTAFALSKLMPQLKSLVNTSDNCISLPNRLKQLISHGTTLSYLVAAWTVEKFDYQSVDENSAYKEIFTYFPKSVEIVNRNDRTVLHVKSYEFKYWLIMYYINKLVATLYKPTKLSLSPQVGPKILHCCINLHAPNLLNLFDFPFCLDYDMLRVAAKLGNIHLFRKWRPLLNAEEDRTRYKIYHNSLYLAVHNLHLGDIAYLADVKQDYYRYKYITSCENLVDLCKNTTTDNIETIHRKTLALDIIIRNKLISLSSIENTIINSDNIHPHIVSFLVSMLIDMISKHNADYVLKGHELHFSILSRNPEAVEFFILRGANVNNACKCCSLEPIKICITSQFDIKVFKTLLRNGLRINHNTCDMFLKYLSPSDFYMARQLVISSYPQYSFEFSMEILSQIVSVYNEEVQKCLYCSAIERGGSKKEFDYISKWFGKISFTCRTEHLPLHKASKYGNLKAIEYLLLEGINVNSKCHCCGSTALYWCLKFNEDARNLEDMVDHLLKCGANTNQSNNTSVTPMEFALILRKDKKVSEKVIQSMNQKEESQITKL